MLCSGLHLICYLTQRTRVFAFLHLKAFTYKPYVTSSLTGDRPPGKTPRLRSLGHALDFRDIFRQFWHGCVYAWARMRGFEPDHQNERRDHLERALGQRRMLGAKVPYNQLDHALDEKSSGIRSDRPAHGHGRQRGRDKQWLGDLPLPDSPLEEDIDAELRRIRMASEYQKKSRADKKRSTGHRRDVASSDPDAFDIPGQAPPPPAKKHFWRGLYDRVSHGSGQAHAPVPLADEEDDIVDEWYPTRAPSWVKRASFSPHGPPDLNDEPPSRGMVVASRPTLAPPSPKSPQRSDSFMHRVFTAEVASSEGSHSRSRENSHDMLGAQGGMAWGAAVKQLASTSAADRSGLVQPAPQASSTTRITSTPISPTRSSHGSLHGHVSRGPSTRPPAGPVMPNPLSPARFPGYPEPGVQWDSQYRSPTSVVSEDSERTVRPARSQRPSRSPASPRTSSPLSPPPTFMDPLDAPPPRSSPLRGSRP